jgi:hypothetical protein
MISWKKDKSISAEHKNKIFLNIWILISLMTLMEPLKDLSKISLKNLSPKIKFLSNIGNCLKKK